MTASEENQEANPAASSQEKPRSEPAKGMTPEEKRETTSAQADEKHAPAPPPVSGTPRKTRILPERQQQAETPATLADLGGWMPPVEDQVARFLNDVAEIAPPPVREREGPTPSFVLPPAISPEEAKRKKAKAEPFWSQVVATPMEQPNPGTRTRPRSSTRRRGRADRRWFFLAGGIVLLVVLAVAVWAAIHFGLLPFK